MYCIFRAKIVLSYTEHVHFLLLFSKLYKYYLCSIYCIIYYKWSRDDLNYTGIVVRLYTDITHFKWRTWVPVDFSIGEDPGTLSLWVLRYDHVTFVLEVRVTDFHIMESKTIILLSQVLSAYLTHFNAVRKLILHYFFWWDFHYSHYKNWVIMPAHSRNIASTMIFSFLLK